MIRVHLDSTWRVRVRYTALLPVPRPCAWSVLRDFERIACLDHFHRGVDLAGRRPASGVTFDLPHGLLGFRISRRGRILRWTEGRGYAFSDLSARDPRRVFPHVFVVDVSSPGEAPRETRCQLELSICGRWTARFLPRPLVRLWLAWNLLSLGLEIENAVLHDTLPERRRARQGEGVGVRH